MAEFADGNITKQVTFVGALEGPQKVTYISLQAFNRVAMHLVKTIAVVIACALVGPVTHRVALSLHTVVALIFVDIEQSIRLSELMHMGAEGSAPRCCRRLPTALVRFHGLQCQE